LFKRICALTEYYIPRVEQSIMETYIQEMVDLIGMRALLIEYGSGECDKVRILLDHLHDPVAYVPVDISREFLLHVTDELSTDYPTLDVLPVCADYTDNFEMPIPKQPHNKKVIYFPGSTIGNFDPVSAGRFLKHITQTCKPGDGLLIGADLKKDSDILHSAYNDGEGVTAAFNLNLLQRINDELGTDFQTEWFEHNAFYNPEKGRVEMHLVSQREHTVHIGNMVVPFAEGESIWTESSYKFTLGEFEEMAIAAGLDVEHVWTDERQWFSVHYLVTAKR